MNISKIAKLAGVSPATVSRYLNNGYCSDEKKEKIQQIIADTGYTPSQTAQTLRTKRNNLIGVIVPRLSSESVARMVDGISEAIDGTKYNILLANTDNNTDKELDFLSIFRNNIVDGVILIGTMFTRKHHNILKDYEKPVVVLGQCEKKYTCVYHDDFGAAYDATKMLVNSGCKSLACVHCTLKDKSAGKQRYEGFLKATCDSGIKAEENLCVESSFNIDGGVSACKKLIDCGKHFDGIFCATDTIAYGVKATLEENGYEIGKDIKLVGIGDSIMSAQLRPALSTVRLHHKTGGLEACRLLLEMLDSESAVVKQYKLGYEIKERESTL